MVNLVLVSHSRKLAEATAELAAQMVPPQVKILVAAGIGDKREELGTDAVEILESIQSAYSDDGVLVLMDLGSAILSAEMALEMLDPDMQEKVIICPAPFVEGTISAGVQAGLGASLESVYREAVNSLFPKQEQIQPPAFISQSETQSVLENEQPQLDEQGVVLTMINPHGLHARPASKFVQTASSFDADIQVKNLTTGKGPVSAKSLNSIAALGVDHQHQIRVTAVGKQAVDALASLQELVESGFGELEETPAGMQMDSSSGASKITDSRALTGLSISAGVAYGPLSHFVKNKVVVKDTLIDDSQSEWKRLENAISEVQSDIQVQRDRLAERVGEEFAAILDAHLMMLDDPDMADAARDRILKEKKNAEFSWQAAIQDVVDQFEALENDYFKQRAADVKGIGEQVLFKLAGVSAGLSYTASQPMVVIADELTPSDTAKLDWNEIAALITIQGGAESHSAILARAVGIPAVSGVELDALKNPDGISVLVDGTQGAVWVDPPTDVLEKYKAE